MLEITLSQQIRERCPELQLSCILTEVKVEPAPLALINEMSIKTALLQEQLSIADISKLPEIESARKAYKACGKDPARYRLSAEALLRRVVSGKGLYQINNVVDQLNLVSISTGFSIGGYDFDQIQGEICFGIGDENEAYQGIGRGELNIAGLPVFRDALSAFGTPTSDSPRTEVNAQTRRFLMILIGFGGSDGFSQANALAISLLKTYCSASQPSVFQIP